MVGTFTFMLLATMVKDLAEDYFRWKADHELNCSETHVLRGGALVVVQWREIIVGDIVQIRRDEAVPADLFFISSSDQKHGQCFIDTCQLDGETNLKAHLALAATKNLATPEAVGDFTGAVESEAPHAGLYKYSGKLEIGGDVKLLGPSQVRGGSKCAFPSECLSVSEVVSTFVCEAPCGSAGPALHAAWSPYASS
jgi:phospholipid-transporting ATPase